MARKSIITGICGQDGAYLAQLLLEKGHEVIGITRHGSNPHSSVKNLKKLNIQQHINLIPCDLFSYPDVKKNHTHNKSR